MCNYVGYEFGAAFYPDSYCIDGKLHDADSPYLNDEDVPCPMCDRDAAIQWWLGRWEGTCEVGDERSWDDINAEHLANATSLVDDIRKNRGVQALANREGNLQPRKAACSKSAPLSVVRLTAVLGA